MCSVYLISYSCICMKRLHSWDTFMRTRFAGCGNDKLLTSWLANAIHFSGPLWGVSTIVIQNLLLNKCRVVSDSRLGTSLQWNARHGLCTFLYGTSKFIILHVLSLYFYHKNKPHKPQITVHTAVWKYNAPCVNCKRSVIFKTIYLCH